MVFFPQFATLARALPLPPSLSFPHNLSRAFKYFSVLQSLAVSEDFKIRTSAPGDARAGPRRGRAPPSPAAFAAAAASEATWLTAKRFLKMHDINKCLMRLLPMQLRQSAVHSAKILAFGAGLRDCPHGTFEPSFSLRCPCLCYLSYCFLQSL